MRKFLKTFGLLWNYFGIFGVIFWEDFLVWIFGRNLLGGFFWRNFLGGILWERLIDYGIWKEFMFLSRFWGKQGRRKGGQEVRSLEVRGKLIALKKLKNIWLISYIEKWHWKPVVLYLNFCSKSIQIPRTFLWPFS